MMVPYLHFTGGDHLFFKTWHPSSHGAIAGACIGLVIFAILERWVDAMRALAEDHWRRRHVPHTVVLPRHPHDMPSAPPRKIRSPRTIPPFMASHDIPRGVMYAFQALLMYALMLAVMTFQAAYIISIIVGLGIGEVLFGRIGGAKSHMLH
ncbi:Ctr copper transporter [Trametes elegans]|nr:Ctr copper transporter [Trametes elegans]